MKALLVIGIGCGDPDLVTMQAARMIAAADVFVLLDKGDSSVDLLAARRAILDRYARGRHRTVTLDDPRRDPSLPYADAVHRWHDQRVVALERLFADGVGPDETAAVLVWGDPSLYDSTLRIVDEILARRRGRLRRRGRRRDQQRAAPRRPPPDPAAPRRGRRARHHRAQPHRRRRRGGSTTSWSCSTVPRPSPRSSRSRSTSSGAWYLGTPDEILIAGPLDAVAGDVVRARRARVERKGWIFDVYYLRRR